MNQVRTFRAELQDVLAARGLKLHLWGGGTRRSGHLLEIRTQPKPTVLYVHESNATRGFWGLTRNQVSRLAQAPIRWFAVLLLRSPRAGYLLSGGQVGRRIQDGTFKLARDGDYKVNEGRLDAGQGFQTLNQLVEQLL